MASKLVIPLSPLRIVNYVPKWLNVFTLHFNTYNRVPKIVIQLSRKEFQQKKMGHTTIKCITRKETYSGILFEYLRGTVHMWHGLESYQ